MTERGGALAMYYGALQTNESVSQVVSLAVTMAVFGFLFSMLRPMTAALARPQRERPTIYGPRGERLLPQVLAPAEKKALVRRYLERTREWKRRLADLRSSVYAAQHDARVEDLLMVGDPVDEAWGEAWQTMVTSDRALENLETRLRIRLGEL